MSSSTSTSQASEAAESSTSKPKNEFDQYIVRRDDSGIYRKCPYCGKEVWDGPHSVTASGFAFHLSTKILAHSEKPEWKLKYGKDSWTLSSHSDD
jgi:hypothetical protein